jgi:hypothetical protein
MPLVKWASAEVALGSPASCALSLHNAERRQVVKKSVVTGGLGGAFGISPNRKSVVTGGLGGVLGVVSPNRKSVVTGGLGGVLGVVSPNRLRP